MVYIYFSRTTPPPPDAMSHQHSVYGVTAQGQQVDTLYQVGSYDSYGTLSPLFLSACMGSGSGTHEAEAPASPMEGVQDWDPTVLGEGAWVCKRLNCGRCVCTCLCMFVYMHI